MTTPAKTPTPRIDPASCTNNIKDPVKRRKKLEDTRNDVQKRITQDVERVYLLTIAIAECDIEIMKTKGE